MHTMPQITLIVLLIREGSAPDQFMHFWFYRDLFHTGFKKEDSECVANIAQDAFNVITL